MLLDPMSHPSFLDMGNLVNRADPRAKELVAWWLVLPQRRGGAWLFDLMRANHGTLSGFAASPTTTSGWGNTTRPGGFGELRFDGTDDYVEMLSLPAPINNLTALTCMAWVYPTVNGDMALYSQDDLGGSSTAGWHLSLSSSVVGNGAIQFARRFATTSLDAYTFNSTMSLNRWQHVAVTWRGGTAKTTVTFVRDGVVTATSGSGTNGAGALTDLSTYAARLGMRTNDTQPFTGVLDDLRVYARALSTAEIRGAYLNSRLGYPGLLNRLPLWPQPLLVDAYVPFPQYTGFSQAVHRAASW